MLSNGTVDKKKKEHIRENENSLSTGTGAIFLRFYIYVTDK